MKRCRYPVVEVVWLDSAQLDNGDWVHRERMLEVADDLSQRTVGYLVHEADLSIVVARSVSDWADSVEKLEGVLAIPRGCIVEQRVLVPARGGAGGAAGA